MVDVPKISGDKLDIFRQHAVSCVSGNYLIVQSKFRNKRAIFLDALCGKNIYIFIKVIDDLFFK